MAMQLNPNLRNNAAAFRAAARLLQQAGEDDVSSALFWVGLVTCVTAVRAATSWPAESAFTYSVYHGALAGSFIGGLSTMFAAGWVAGDARRRATGRMILCTSLVPMVIVLGISNNFDVFFDILDAI